MAELKIKADSGGGTVSFKGPATTTSNAAVQLTLPVDDGTANQFLKTDGSGALSWAAAGVDGISSSADATAITIDSSENVGIGTGSPSARLHVNSGTANGVATFESSDAGAGINLTDDSARSSIEQNGTTLKISSDTDAGDADSDIRLQVDGGTKVKVDSTGDLTISDGDLVIGTSGHGIDFSTGAGGDATSNILDEYEEGTYTAVLKYNNSSDCGFSTSPAGGTDLYYTKIGRLVHVVGYIKGWTMTSGDGSNATITLPFAVTGGRNQAPGNVAHYTCFNHSVVRCLAEPSSTRLDFFQDNSTSRTTWSSGTSNYIALSVTYFTDT